MIDGGEYAVYQNCESYASGQLTATGASELVANGDSSTFIGCTFGSLANFQAGTGHATMLMTQGIAGAGKVLRDNHFVDCLFWTNAAATTESLVYGANANDVQRMLLFNNCGFINAGNAVYVPAQAIKSGASLTVGRILCDRNCYADNCTKLSTTTGVFFPNTTGLMTQCS